jgi:hypothetical protein
VEVTVGEGGYRREADDDRANRDADAKATAP